MYIAITTYKYIFRNLLFCKVLNSMVSHIYTYNNYNYVIAQPTYVVDTSKFADSEINNLLLRM